MDQSTIRSFMSLARHSARANGRRGLKNSKPPRLEATLLLIGTMAQLGVRIAAMATRHVLLLPAADAIPRKADVFVDDFLRELDRLLGRHPPLRWPFERDGVGGNCRDGVQPGPAEGAERT